MSGELEKNIWKYGMIRNGFYGISLALMISAGVLFCSSREDFHPEKKYFIEKRLDDFKDLGYVGLIPYFLATGLFVLGASFDGKKRKLEDPSGESLKKKKYVYEKVEPRSKEEIWENCRESLVESKEKIFRGVNYCKEKVLEKTYFWKNWK